MRGRRDPVVLLALVAGATVAIAFAAWMLRPSEKPEGAAAPDAPAPAPDPPVPAPAADRPAPPAAPTPVPAPAPDRPPWATIRVLDATTRGPARRLHEAQLLLLVRAGEGEARLPQHLRVGEDGSLEVADGRASDSIALRHVVAPEDLERGRCRLRVPGYRAAEFASRDALRAAGEVLLQPIPPSARGVLVAGRGVEATAVWTELFPGRESPAPPPEEAPFLPSAFGPLELHELTAGRWRLEARARLPQGVLARATREFEVGAGVADLGEIRVVAPTTVLARVVARDRTPVLDPGLSASQRGEAAVGRPGEDGWIAFPDLDPGVPVRVASSLPGLAQEVTLPDDGGDEVRVELEWEEEGVRCRLRFLVDGVAPTRWGDIVEGPELDKGAWKKDGFLEHDMAPGDYLFGIQAEPVGKTGMRTVWAHVQVPRQPGWSADVSFTEEPGK